MAERTEETKDESSVKTEPIVKQESFVVVGIQDAEGCEDKDHLKLPSV